MELVDLKARNYCKTVLVLIKREFRMQVHSVILFGSHARNQANSLSDVDLLIILKSDVKNPASIKKKLSSKLLYLDQMLLHQTEKQELRYYFLGTLIKPLIFSLKYATGMFKSFFIATETELRVGDFSAIFNTNRILSKVLAPTKDVFNNIKRDGVVLYGENSILKKIPASNNRSSILKLFMLNSFIGLCALILRPFEDEMKLFSYEALKWSLFAFNKKLHIGIEKTINHPLFSVMAFIFIVKLYSRHLRNKN